MARRGLRTPADVESLSRKLRGVVAQMGVSSLPQDERIEHHKTNP